MQKKERFSVLVNVTDFTYNIGCEETEDRILQFPETEKKIEGALWKLCSGKSRSDLLSRAPEL